VLCRVIAFFCQYDQNDYIVYSLYRYDEVNLLQDE